MTEIESDDRSVPLKVSTTRRLLLTRLHRDSEGNPEWFMFAYAIKRATSHGECLDGVRTQHQSRKTEPFLGGWRGAMSHWASDNVDTLKSALLCYKYECGRSIRLRPMSNCVLVTPSPPARPELSTLVSWTLERSSGPRRPLLCVS